MNILQSLFDSLIWNLIFQAVPLLLVLLYTIIRILPRRNKSDMQVDERSSFDLYKSRSWRDTGWSLLVLAVVTLYAGYIFFSWDRFGDAVFLPDQIHFGLLISGICLFGLGCMFLWHSDELMKRSRSAVAGKGSTQGHAKFDMKLPLAGICIGILFFAMIIPYTLRTVDCFRLIRV